jgi:small subunit ribosomal protein S5
MEKGKLPEAEESKLETVEAAVAVPEEVELPAGVIIKEEDSWMPKTSLGKQVKEGKITNIDEILEKGLRILEARIVDLLIPNLETDFIMVGQSKGKFGGGKRSIWRQTQKKTAEGNKPKFAALAIIGNKNGYIGYGYGKAKETVPAREKSIRKAKLNMIKIKTGCGSWECNCNGTHSIPFTVKGKCGSVEMKIMPAPKGTGLCIEKECAKMLNYAGIKDVYSRTFGQSRTKLNLISACFEALIKLNSTKTFSKRREEIPEVIE